MILVDFQQVAISTLMAEMGPVGVQNFTKDNIPLLRHMIFNCLRSYRRKFGKEYGELVICTEGGHNWRREVFQYYKWQRRQKQKADQSQAWELIFDTFRTVREDLTEYFPYNVINVPGTEADDAIARIALTAKQDDDLPFGPDFKVLIVSGDKDFGQLLSTHVHQYAPIQKKMVKVANPRQFLEEHILNGDKDDGIPNVLSPEDCFVTGQRQTPMTAKRMEELITKPMDEATRKRFVMNTLLIDLSKTPAKYKTEIDRQVAEFKSPGRHMIMNYFVKNRMAGLLDNLEDF